MKAAWLSNLPAVRFFASPESPRTPTQQTFQKPFGTMSPVVTAQENPANPVSTWLQQLARPLVGLFNRSTASSGAAASFSPARPVFMMPDQRQWQEQVETYAESPFETALFSMKKRPKAYEISKAWADGIKSQDPLSREAALTLLKGYLTYSGLGDLNELSAHTQMKFLIFAPHLNEGIIGKAILYEALLTLPPSQFLAFATTLRNDFANLPPMAQTLLLKQMMATWKSTSNHLGEDELTEFKHLMKTLVIQFYTGRQEAIAQMLNQADKVRLGFLKMQPIEEAYRKQLEEIERRYRLKLRQLKKQRSQKIAEAEEEKLRRIEMIYEDVEDDLASGLSELTLAWDQVMAG